MRQPLIRGIQVAAFFITTCLVISPVTQATPLKRSDIMLSPRAGGANYWYSPYTKYQPTRIAWTYANDSFVEYFAENNPSFPVQCTVPFWVPNNKPVEVQEKMECLDHNGDYGGFSSDTRKRPDINSPEWRTYQLDEVKRLIDIGCTHFQQDTAKLNAHLAEKATGCYQQNSIDLFRFYLDTVYSDVQLGLWGITNIATFDFRVDRPQALINAKKWEEFQIWATKLYHDWLHEQAELHAGHQILFSGNVEAGLSGDWSWIAPHFDFLLSEMYGTHAEMPVNLREFSSATRSSFSMPSGVTIASNNVTINKLALHSAYALGIVPIIPWDVFYLNNQNKRFCGAGDCNSTWTVGNDLEYNKTFNLVRQNPALFDDYRPWKDYYGTYLNVLPSEGYVQTVETNVVLSGVTYDRIFWNRRASHPITTSNNQVWIDGRLFTAQVTSSYGVIYVPPQSGIKAGDPVYFDTEYEKFLITIRKPENNNDHRRVVHVVNWRNENSPPFAVFTVHVAKSNFDSENDRPTHYLSENNSTPLPITPIDMGDYYIYEVGNLNWTVLLKP